MEAWSFLRAGQAEEAAAAAQEAVTVAAEQAPSVLPEARFVEAAILVAEGDREGGASRALDVARIARETRQERTEFLCLHLAWTALRAADRGREAADLEGRLTHLARSLAAVLDEARAYLAQRAASRQAGGEKE